MGEPDETFGPYELRELLGRGGMGEVWRAFDTRREREVALKRLPEELSSRPDFRARFQREARSTARLSSLHVVPIHDFGEIDGRVYLDMRLVTGGNLLDAIRGTGGVDVARAVRILAQVADALDSAHAEGMVHRDVKPSNVMLAPYRDGDFCYLVDFGIAKIVDDTSAPLTGTGTLLGTTPYMAPELYTSAAASPHSDVYALGCTFFEMLAGRRAFDATDEASLMNAHVSGPIPTLADGHPELAAFDPVLRRALAKDPEDRFRNAGAFADAAATVRSAQRPRVAPEAPTATAPGPGPAAPEQLEQPEPQTEPIEVRRRGVRRPSLIALAAVGVVAVVAAVVVSVSALGGSPAPTAAPAPAPAPPPARSDPLARPLPLSLENGAEIALTPDGTRAYVAEAGYRDAPSTSVAIVDLGARSVVGRIGVGRSPLALAMSPDGRALYVANTGVGDDPRPDSVSVVDTTSNAVVATIPVGDAPLGVAVSPDGGTVYVTDSGQSQAVGRTVSVIDTATRSVRATVPVGERPFGVAVSPDGRSVYVTNYGPQSAVENTVSIIDAATSTVTNTVTVEDGPRSVAVGPDGRAVYVASIGTNAEPNGALVAVDPTSRVPAATVSRSDFFPWAVAVTPDSRRAIVVQNQSDPAVDAVTVFDTATTTITGAVQVGRGAYDVAVAPDGRRAYVTTNETVWGVDLPP